MSEIKRAVHSMIFSRATLTSTAAGGVVFTVMRVHVQKYLKNMAMETNEPLSAVKLHAKDIAPVAPSDSTCLPVCSHLQIQHQVKRPKSPKNWANCAPFSPAFVLGQPALLVLSTGHEPCRPPAGNIRRPDLT